MQRKYRLSKKVVSKFAGFCPSGVDFSNFRQNRFSQRLKRFWGSKNKVGEENWLFFQFFIKISKKGKKGTRWVNCGKLCHFFVFHR